MYGPDRKPLLSWRVLLLPYIEERELYAQFRLDEAWDSAHNVSLLDQMPRIYAPPKRKQDLVPPNQTVCHVIIGSGTAFEESGPVRLADGFPAGTSKTLLLVEAGSPVPWTKPEDIVYDPNGPLPRLRGLFKDGFRACFADGTPTFVRDDISDSELRAAVTRNGEP